MLVLSFLLTWFNYCGIGRTDNAITLSWLQNNPLMKLFDVKKISLMGSVKDWFFSPCLLISFDVYKKYNFHSYWMQYFFQGFFFVFLRALKIDTCGYLFSRKYNFLNTGGCRQDILNGLWAKISDFFSLMFMAPTCQNLNLPVINHQSDW